MKKANRPFKSDYLTLNSSLIPLGWFAQMVSPENTPAAITKVKPKTSATILFPFIQTPPI